eukprot:Nk52_evm10s233 gene=Nk52_evmTU10s233
MAIPDNDINEHFRVREASANSKEALRPFKSMLFQRTSETLDKFEDLDCMKRQNVYDKDEVEKMSEEIAKEEATKREQMQKEQKELELETKKKAAQNAYAFEDEDEVSDNDVKKAYEEYVKKREQELKEQKELKLEMRRKRGAVSREFEKVNQKEKNTEGKAGNISDGNEKLQSLKLLSGLEDNKNTTEDGASQNNSIVKEEEKVTGKEDVTGTGAFEIDRMKEGEEKEKEKEKELCANEAKGGGEGEEETQIPTNVADEDVVESGILQMENTQADEDDVAVIGKRIAEVEIPEQQFDSQLVETPPIYSDTLSQEPKDADGASLKRKNSQSPPPVASKRQRKNASSRSATPGSIDGRSSRGRTDSGGYSPVTVSLRRGVSGTEKKMAVSAWEIVNGISDYMKHAGKHKKRKPLSVGIRGASEPIGMKECRFYGTLIESFKGGIQQKQDYLNSEKFKHYSKIEIVSDCSSKNRTSLPGKTSVNSQLMGGDDGSQFEVQGVMERFFVSVGDDCFFHGDDKGQVEYLGRILDIWDSSAPLSGKKPSRNSQGSVADLKEGSSSFNCLVLWFFMPWETIGYDKKKRKHPLLPSSLPYECFVQTSVLDINACKTIKRVACVTTNEITVKKRYVERAIETGVRRLKNIPTNKPTPEFNIEGSMADIESVLMRREIVDGRFPYRLIRYEYMEANDSFAKLNTESHHLPEGFDEKNETKLGC